MVIARSVLRNILMKAPHSSSFRARSRMLLVMSNLDLYSVLVSAVFNLICYFGPRYNGTRLYLFVECNDVEYCDDLRVNGENF